MLWKSISRSLLIGLAVHHILFIGTSVVTAQDTPSPDDVDETTTDIDGNESPCSVCRDGSEPNSTDIPFRDALGVTIGLTCEDIIVTASSEQQGSERCHSLQLAAFQGGCCSQSSYLDESNPFDRCALCPNGEGVGFLAFKEIPPIERIKIGMTCSDVLSDTNVITEFLQVYLQTPGSCDDTLLRRTAGWCGCIRTTVECDLCSGKEIMMSRMHPLSGVTCHDLQYKVSWFNTTQCADAGTLLKFDPEALCCPNSNEAEVSSTISCPLCTDQQGLTSDKIVSTEAYGEVTCGNAQAAADLLISDLVCTELREEFSTECCVSASESLPTCEFTCPETGERPPNLLLQDEVTGYSCSYLVAEYAKFTASQCGDATNMLGFDAVTLCCNGTDGKASSSVEGSMEGSYSPSPPTSDPGQDSRPMDTSYDCRICPSGEELSYPRRVLFAFQQQTCEEVELSARLVTTKTVCHPGRIPMAIQSLSFQGAVLQDYWAPGEHGVDGCRCFGWCGWGGVNNDVIFLLSYSV
ncbi:hypothetical protein IV203_002661 [Nitzschia inconspicua]|uniref:Uncharacterized protein n=1 Tax=Nitzschia inconspicua TaxID=303405 RepID=A0A9K3K8L5_9STRA|nr:hypothetical protein IV203_002661 [Nitzschia inconspicua]